MEERNPIFEIVNVTGLNATSTDYWRGIPYGWADSWYKDTECVFAKYLLTFTTAEQWNQMYMAWESFVAEVVEPVYFQLANDISWNLYWASVLNEDQLNRLDPQQRLSFCSNTEYTRNMVIPLERISQFIPVGRNIHLAPSRETMQLPSDIWMQQLEPDGLSFCLKGFSQASLEQYVDGMTPKASALGEATVPRADGRSLSMLHSISIPQNFREHYYQKAWDIPFQQVNLLYGANGSGKTSVISGIELGITGEIRSLSDSEDTSVPIGITLQAEEDGHTISLNPPCTDADKKQRERRWYQGRSNNRTGPQLQNYFHRFNYLSVEETFLFASQQPDLSDIFSKILYGIETSDMWAHKNRYQDKCNRMIETLEQELKREIRLFGQRSEVPLAHQTELRAYISASELNLDPDGTPSEILVRAQKVRAEYDKVRDLAPIASSNQIQQKRFEQETNRSALQKMQKELLEKYNQAVEQVKKLSNAEEIATKECKENDARWNALQTLEPLLRLFQFYTLHRNEFDIYQSCCEQLESWRSREIRLRMFMTDDKKTLEHSPEKSAHQIFQEMTALQKEHSALKDKLDEINTQISQEELAQEQRTKLFSSLRATGIELYRMQENRHICPLCGTDGITKDRLLSHLEKESSQANQLLQELYQKKADLESQTATVGSNLKRLDRQQAAAFKYEDALNRLQQEFPDINSFSDLCRQHEFAVEQKNSIQAKSTRAKDTLLEKLREIDSNSTIEDVLDCKRHLFDLALSVNLHLSLDESNESLLEHLSQMKEERGLQKEKSVATLHQIRGECTQQAQVVDSYEKELKHIRKQIEQMEIESTYLTRLETFWAQINDIAGSTNLTGEAVQGMCEHICKLAHNVIDYTQYIEAKEVHLKSKSILEQKLQRCHLLKEKLTALNPSEFYAKQFIHQNIAQISQIFLTLHSPQEFSRLDITEDNKLAAYRNDRAVPVSHMSTGQRTALVVAVFFQMTLATPFAPNFLLLDEPVANVDDLNVLALMDFLRELAITHGKQIFFTTANRNVAKLFRRKFSFLQGDFQEIYFSRENEHCLQIVSRSYNQNRLLCNRIL